MCGKIQTLTLTHPLTAQFVKLFNLTLGETFGATFAGGTRLFVDRHRHSLSHTHIPTQFVKPFNPILGETLEATFAGGTRLFVEQTSHHPPVTSWLLLVPPTFKSAQHQSSQEPHTPTHTYTHTHTHTQPYTHYSKTKLHTLLSIRAPKPLIACPRLPS